MTAEQLRNSILQEAISGRLVPQDPNDEPASALLARIREEKARLVKEGKLKKKDLVETPIKEEEIPFEIPSSWEWCRINEISRSYIGLTYSPSDVCTDGVIVLRSSNIKNGKLDLQDLVRVKKDINEKLQVNPNDIIICARNGSKKLVGKSALVTAVTEPMTFGAFMAICKTEYYSYVYWFLQSDLFFSQLRKVSDTTTINQLTQNNFNNFVIPLPPLAEQQRIVAKLEELLPLVEQYGKAQTELDQLNATLPSRLRQSILQEAIQGKLVPQDEKDEPVETILKKYSVKSLDSEEELPSGWSLVKMGDLTEFINGLAFKPEDWKEKGLPIVRIQNLSNPNQPIHYTDKEIPDKFIINDGQLLFSWSATLDAFIWNRGKACLNQHIFKLVPQPFIDKIYLYYLLKAIVEEYKKVTHGSTMKHITKGIFENYEVMLPPLAEQQRIVAKIEELFAEIDKLAK